MNQARSEKQGGTQTRPIRGEKLWLAAALVALTALGAVLRLYDLGQWSLWQDEVFTWRDSAKAIDSGFFSYPVSYQMVGYMVGFLGPTEWSLRIYPALVGIISIPVLFLVVRKLFDFQTALISASFITLSHWHLYWSQNARFYTSLMLFYGLALLALISWLENPQKKSSLFATILFLVLATQERLVGALSFLPVFAVAVILIYFAKPSWRSKIGVTKALVALVALGFLFIAFAFQFIMNPKQWLAIFGWANNNVFWLGAGIAYYIGLSTICIAAVGTYCLYRERPVAALTLVSAATVPIILLMAISPFHYTASRYAFVTLPAWIILAAYAISYFLKKREREARILAVGVFLTLAVAYVGENYLYYTYQKGNRPDWKSAFHYLLRHKKDNERVFMTTPLLGQFYLNEKPEAIGQFDAREIQPDERLWFIVDMTTGEKHPRKLAWIHEHAREIANFDIHVKARNFRMGVYQYRAPAAPQTNINPPIDPAIPAAKSSSGAITTALATPD